MPVVFRLVLARSRRGARRGPILARPSGAGAEGEISRGTATRQGILTDFHADSVGMTPYIVCLQWRISGRCSLATRFQITELGLPSAQLQEGRDRTQSRPCGRREGVRGGQLRNPRERTRSANWADRVVDAAESRANEAVFRAGTLGANPSSQSPFGVRSWSLPRVPARANPNHRASDPPCRSGMLGRDRPVSARSKPKRHANVNNLRGKELLRMKDLFGERERTQTPLGVERSRPG